MNTFAFDTQDFSVFSIEGLHERMDALKQHIRPKLEQLGIYFTPFFTAHLQQDFFPHVAKHARRTVHPPNDTWVAFATNKRGYKMLPHFQIGLWESHVFIYFGVIYECTQKETYAKGLLQHMQEVRNLPHHFMWSTDHMKPTATPAHTLTEAELQYMFERLSHVKKAELLTGIHIPKEEAISMDDEAFLTRIEETFITLLPLYKLAFSSDF